MNVADWSLSNAELAAVRETLRIPSLEFELRAAWNSNNADHRALIRSELALRFGNERDLTDLERRPETADRHFSISHCKVAGGFLAAEKPARVGFDIEEIERPSRTVLERVASKEEVFAAPSLAHLWTAKEAAFKSLPASLQPTVFTEISVGDWTRHPSEDFWIYLAKSRAQSGTYGIGAVFGRLRLAVAFFANHV